MKHLLTLSALVGLAAPAVAQDEIHWTDGSVSKDVSVQSFTVNEVAYRGGGGNQTRSSAEVRKLILGKASDVYRRGAASKDPGLYLNVARELIKSRKKPDQLMAQVGFATAADLSYSYGDDAIAVQTLAELVQGMADSGYAPKLHQMKLTIYLGRGDAKNARSAATKYKQDAQGKGWPNYYQAEGAFFEVLADKVGGKAPAELEKDLSSLARQVAGEGAISARVQVELANVMRETGKDSEADKIYRAMIKRDDLDDPTRAGVYIGLGYLALAKASPANKEPNLEALRYFLRAYVETKDAWGSQKAEALFQGQEAAKRWGGADSSYMSGKLRYLLGQRYPDSSWAKKR